MSSTGWERIEVWSRRAAHLGGVETEMSGRGGGILAHGSARRWQRCWGLGVPRGVEVSRLGGILAHNQDVHRRSIVAIGGRRAPGSQWLGLRSRLFTGGGGLQRRLGTEDGGEGCRKRCHGGAAAKGTLVPGCLASSCGRERASRILFSLNN